MRKIATGTAFVLSAGILSACNENTAQNPAPVDTAAAPAPADQTAASGTNNETVSAVQDATAGAVGTVAAELTTTTDGFSKAAAMSDMYEVQAGKIAQQRAKSPDVKAFGKMMVEAHTATGNTLKSILKKANITVDLPAALDSRHQGLIDNLNGAKDEDFDARYLNQQENAHQEAVIMFRGYAKDGDNADVKQFAADTAPKIQEHLDKADALDKNGADQNNGQVNGGDLLPSPE